MYTFPFASRVVSCHGAFVFHDAVLRRSGADIKEMNRPLFVEQSPVSAISSADTAQTLLLCPATRV